MRHLGNNWWDRHYRMICWMLVFLLLFLLLHAIGLRITPILRQTARFKATNLVTEQIERQVQESLQKSKGSFVKVERDEEGNILSIGLDVVEANRLRSELAVELVQPLEQEIFVLGQLLKDGVAAAVVQQTDADIFFCPSESAVGVDFLYPLLQLLLQSHQPVVS